MVEKLREIRLYIRAFIPRTIMRSDGTQYTRALSGGAYVGKTVIPGPRLLPPIPGVPNWFLSDNRSFDSSPSSGARMHMEVLLDARSGAVSAPSTNGGRSNPGCDLSVGFDELAGEVVAEGHGDSSRMTITSVQTAPQPGGGLKASFTLRGAANNPLVPGSFDIDWALNVVVLVDAGNEIASARVSGLVDPFPAFEMYVGVEGAPLIPVFQLDPRLDADPWNLIGPPNRPITGSSGSAEIVTALGATLDGVWISNEPAKRFRLQISTTNVTFVERNVTGATFSRAALLLRAGGEYRIERSNNDLELLSFLDFKSAVRQAIVATNPRPSFLIFHLDGGNLVAQWSGISVTLKPDGSIDQIFQPGSKPSRAYSFSRAN